MRSDTVFGMPDQLGAINEQLASQQGISRFPDELRTIREELVAQRTQRGTETTIWKEQQTTLGQVSDGVEYLRSEMDSAIQGVQVVTTAQATQTDQKLNEILEQILKLSLGRQKPSRVVNVPEHGHVSADTPGPRHCSELMTSLTQLCGLVNWKQARTAPPETRDVVKELLTTVSHMMSEGFLQGVIAANLVRGGLCEKCCRQHVGELETCLSSVYGVLLSARQITVNRHGKYLSLVS